MISFFFPSPSTLSPKIFSIYLFSLTPGGFVSITDLILKISSSGQTFSSLGQYLGSYGLNGVDEGFLDSFLWQLPSISCKHGI